MDLKNGVVQDKLFLPGLTKLRKLYEADFFGRVLSIRLDFGWWVFDGAPTRRSGRAGIIVRPPVAG